MREEHARGAGQVVDRIERYARLLGDLVVVVLAVPRVGLIGHGVGAVVVVVEELLGTVARVLEVVRVAVEVAGRGYDVEAAPLVGHVQRRQCPSIEGIGLHVEGAVDRVLRNVLRVGWAVSLVRVGERREGRGEPVILGVLVHNAQAPLEIVRHFEQERERAAVARIRPLIADAGAGYGRERQRNDVADGAALRRVGKSAREIAGVMVAERDHAQREPIGAEHDVADDAGARVRAAAARGSPCLQHVADRILGEVGLLRHQTHVAAERALAVERTLRSLEHLDVVDVEHSRIHGSGHRRVVDVEAGCARRTEQILSSDAANRDRAGFRDAGGTSAVGEGDVGRLGRIVVERLDVVVLEILRRERRDAHRHLRQGLVALSRRHDDGIERRRLRRRPPPSCPAHRPRPRGVRHRKPPTDPEVARRSFDEA